MKKIIISLILLLGISNMQKANAGIFEWEYFEPTAGCAIGAAVGYSTGTEGEEMKNAAIYCAVAGTVGFLIKGHYESKYGAEFENQELFLKDQIKKYNLLEQQKNEKKESLYFRKVRQVIPPRLLPNGQGIGPRIKERLQLKDFNDRVGL